LQQQQQHNQTQALQSSLQKINEDIKIMMERQKQEKEVCGEEKEEEEKRREEKKVEKKERKN
jgi:hypothetical protein